MVLQPQPFTPVIIKVVPPPTPDVSVVNIIVDALGLTGLVAIASLVVGLFFGLFLIWFKRWRARTSPDSTSPATRLDLSSR